MPPILRFRGLVAAFEPFACEPGDSDDARVQKAQFTLAMTLIIPAGVVWGAIYLAAGEPIAALMPLVYAVLSSINLVLLRRLRRFRFYQVTELALIVALPFFLQLALGGFVAGSAVVVWALLGPLFAVLFTSIREATIWFVAFIGAVIVAGVAQPSLSADGGLPHWLISAFFVMNFGAVSTIAFAMLLSFVRARSQLRTLELAYLDQTVMLREREKLATLGTLAAGVAHELNNPAAAVRRAASQLEPTLDDLRRRGVALTLGDGHGDDLAAIEALVHARPESSERMSALEQSDREQAMEDWLDDAGLEQPWELAASFVAMGITVADLQRVGDAIPTAKLASVLAMLAQGSEASSLAEIIGSGAQRISDIVAAMRSYSYLDRGVVQIVDVTEGIESTLVLLQSQLRGMKVVRAYAEDLPQIAVRGTELNQVWTNIIANAVDATEGTGTLTVRTELAGDRVAVEFEDDGPGMGPGVADRVFDPFFTTKPPGKGTGLGLNISYNIVVRQHGGEISVVSAPGQTVFRVVLSQTGAVDAAGDGTSTVAGALAPDA